VRYTLLMALTLSKHRIEALTDGIFAIVMTLIVLEIKVPELERHASNGEIVEKLGGIGAHLLSFFLTFVLAGLFWFLHHTLTQFVRHMTRPLILLNLVFLMFVSLLPFSAAMLGRFLHAPIAVQIYYGHQLVLGLLLAVQWEVVRRNDLTTEALTPAERIAMPFRLWTIPVACVVALVTAAAHPTWAQGAFAITAFTGRLVSRRREAALR
jgi:uncharacterized membrane protein